MIVLLQQIDTLGTISSIVKTFFDRAPAKTREGSAAAAAAPTKSTPPANQPLHMCELSPPTVPTILPTLMALLDLLEHPHSHNTAQRIQRVENVDGRLHDSSRNPPAGRPRMAKQRVAMAE